MRRNVERGRVPPLHPLSYPAVTNMQYRQMPSLRRDFVAIACLALLSIGLGACEGEKPVVGSTVSSTNPPPGQVSTTLALTPLEQSALDTGDILLGNVLVQLTAITNAPDPNNPAIADGFSGQAFSQVTSLVTDLQTKGLRLDGQLTTQEDASRVTSVTDTDGALVGFAYEACVVDTQYPVVVATGEQRAGSALDSAYQLEFVRNGELWIADRLVINGPGTSCLVPNQPPVVTNQ